MALKKCPFALAKGHFLLEPWCPDIPLHQGVAPELSGLNEPKPLPFQLK